MAEPDTPPSPVIRAFAWAHMEVEDFDGTVRRYKDAKLFPGGSRGWDWNETGTSHVPGTQVADVEELLEHGARAVVLTRGVNERLGVPDGTVRYLEELGVEVHTLQSEAAVERYGALRDQGRAVGGLFHSTC